MEVKQNLLTLTDGSTLYYQTAGKGEPLILLHGNGSSHNYFHKQIPVFAKFFQVIAVDCRGYGKSKNKKKSLDFQLMADDLLSIIKMERLIRINLVGFSDGANLAMVFASKYPQKIKRLVLNGGNLYFYGLKKHVRLFYNLVYRVMFFLSLCIKPLKKFTNSLALIVHDVGIDYADLEQITAKTLVLVGEHDIMTSLETKQIYQALPFAELQIIDNAPHSLAKRRTNIFNKICLDFLNSD